MINIRNSSIIERKLDSTILIDEKEEAIPLISYDTETKKFLINETAEHILKKLESPIGVISVAGMYRTGKSYLLNRMLLNKSSGFSVGPTINPCTKGLWLWSRPLNGYTPDGTPVNVLVIDTEGIGATDEDQNHDNKIFTLGILLSSYFIFNSSGSIDENAINNLSFIVNITKNIQLNNKEDSDIREISKYLPSFMWVIRDFTLRLVDSYGESITSKEYLEKSLEIQKGYSESVENKNKIRTLIKEFFRERDCVTLVRPLTEEVNLQNLNKMDQSLLRPEFLEQISQLRKKVLHKVKPKTMNGKVLNGEMFVSIMKSYVNAINKGAIPVIENAWTYMCKNECLRSMNEALTKYLNMMNTAKFNLPIDERELRNQHKVARKEAIKFYQESGIGMSIEEYLTQLKTAIKEKFVHFMNDNSRETKKYCEVFLNANYSNIKKNISSAVYKNFTSYKADVDSFITFYLEKAPNGPCRNLILYEFIVNEILAQAEVFTSNSISQLENLSSKNSEEIANLKKMLTERNSEYENEKIKNSEMIKKLESEKNDFEVSEKYTKDYLNSVLKEKEQILKELNEKLDSQKKESEKKINSLNAKLESIYESSRESEMEFSQKKLEFETSKLLTDQKIKNMEECILELKEKERVNELRNHKTETMSKNKEALEKYEVQIKSLQQKYDVIQEKSLELEKNLFEKEKRFENEKNKYEESIRELNEKIIDLNEQITNNENEVKNIENINLSQQEKMKIDSQMKVTEMKEQIETFILKLRDSEEKYSTLKNKTNKEISMLNQNLEFAEVQINDLKTQMSEEKKSHEALFRLLDEKNNNLLQSQEECMQEINSLKAHNLLEIEKLNSQLDESIRNSNHTIDILKSQCKELEEKQIKENKQYELEKSLNETKISDLISELELAQTALQNLANEKENIISQNKSYIENLNLETNQKIEDTLKQCRIEIEEINQRSEIEIQKLKKHFEMEKINLTVKLSEERENMNKQINEMEVFYSEKLKDNILTKEERIFELQETLENLEINHTNLKIEYDRDRTIKTQEIELLNKYLNETRENMSQIQYSHESVMNAQIANVKLEKNEMNSQIEKLINEIKLKERENGIIYTKNEQLNNMIENFKIQSTTTNDEFKSQIESLNNKIDQNLIKIKSQNEEIHILKSDYGKQIALKNQEIEFNTAKMNEMTKKISDLTLKNEEKLKEIKDSLDNEYNERIVNLNKEKLDIEVKLNQKKKELKDIETNLNKNLSMLEKEKSVLNEKLMNLNKERDELVKALERERDLSETKLKNQQTEYQRENDLIVKENEMMRSKLKTLEKDYNELTALYENESTLWANRNQFLEEQKNQVRLELSECQKKFENTLESLSRRSNVENGKIDNMQKAVIQALELKYKNHLKEEQEKYRNKIEEINNKKKNLDSENKNLAEKLRDKLLSHNSDKHELEKKLLLASETESKLKSEILTLNESQEKKIRELNLIIENERSVSRDKIIELETKLREHESKRNNILVDNVMDKVANDTDKLNMQRNIESLNSRILAVERLNLKLINENKELIRDNEKFRKSSRNPSNNSSNIFIPKNRYNTNNKENMNIRSNSNTSFEVTPYNEKFEQYYSSSKPKSSTKSSQKSDKDLDLVLF